MRRWRRKTVVVEDEDAPLLLLGADPVPFSSRVLLSSPPGSSVVGADPPLSSSPLLQGADPPLSSSSRVLCGPAVSTLQCVLVPESERTPQARPHTGVRPLGSQQLWVRCGGPEEDFFQNHLGSRESFGQAAVGGSERDISPVQTHLKMSPSKNDDKCKSLMSIKKHI